MHKNIKISIVLEQNKIFYFKAEASEKLYFALVHTSITVYGSATRLHWPPLCLNKKNALRIISRAKFRDHTKPLFPHHEILPFEELIYSYRVKFMHSYYFKKLPISFAEM